ncbi:DNA polymerase III subunit delta [Amphibiibacter pelophylacis]|uniref:DNA polymerase III subunit delta n=1 Tax=Amphibiibacter pelophylacis TaxID=1799477 RepID=A0ACC6P0T1_9BURK
MPALRSEQLAAHLDKSGLPRLTVITGDELLLVQEAADQVRQCAAKAGHSDRQIIALDGNAGGWRQVVAAMQERDLFGARKLLDLRLPGGKPGKEGGAVLQDLARSDDADTAILLTLPRLDRQQSQSAWYAALESAALVVRADPIERKALPQWIVRRLADQGQRLEAGDAGLHALEMLCARTEGNLLATWQELQKLALLHPPGEITAAQIESAVSNAARYTLSQWTQTIWQADAVRARQIAQALDAEGESAVFAHWTLAEDVRALAAAHQHQQGGMQAGAALRQERVWGPREPVLSAVLRLGDHLPWSQWLEDARICDGITKGLPHPDWPRGDWAALQRWSLRLVAAQRRAAGRMRGRR